MVAPNMDMYDVIVIGGGPAGSTVSNLLSQKGLKVLVLEKEVFPREHVGESLIPYCHDVLKDLGVLEEVNKIGYPKPGVTFSSIDGSFATDWCFSRVISDERSSSVHVRRADFDNILLRGAEAQGTTVLEGHKVDAVDLKGDEVEVQASHNGVTHSFLGRFLIDASGQNTFLANRLKTKKPFESMKKRLALSTHWVNTKPTEDIAEGHIKIVQLDGNKSGWIWLIPLERNRTSVGLALDMDYARRRQKELKKTHENASRELYLSEIFTSSIVSDLLEGAEMDQEVVANGDYSYYSDKKYDRDFAIIGDASAFIDPIFSSGIFLAIRGAQILADAVQTYLDQGKFEEVERAYGVIQNAYDLLERLILTYYDDNAIRLDRTVEYLNEEYEKHHRAISVFHLILAGDFFENSEKYIEAVETLRSAKMLDKYKKLINYAESKNRERVVCK